jgi:sigma-54 dependent transcriptional regulator, acetoin dehydrogenase operon transcriptional activator AcoR
MPPITDPGKESALRAGAATSLGSASAALQAKRLAVIRESHQRCAALGLSRIERPDYEPLMRSDLRLARERNQRLSTRAAPVMEVLLEQIVNSQSMIVLTDAQGTVLHTVGDDDFMQRADKVALAPGVNWAEHSKGTNAIGTTLFSESPTLVHAGEHFMHANSFLTCSAAPIFDPRGNMLGVLDVTGDHRSYHQHTMGLVRMSARMIENHWLTDDYNDRLRLHFHSRSEFIGTLLECIVVVAPDGKLIGANRSAVEMIGLSTVTIRNHTLTSLFGTTPGAVHDQLRSPLAPPMALHLPDGRLVFASVRWNRPTTLALGGTPATDPVPNSPGTPAIPAALTAVRALPAASLNEPAGPRGGLAWLLTGDARIDQLIGKLRRVLNRDVPVLILGETGTGKELLARAMHQDSARARQPFVTVDCAALTETQLEAELFGTQDEADPARGGRQRSPARILQASGGTLFLDEVAALPPRVQARLLRVLQDRRLPVPGSAHGVPVDIAVIGASAQRLRALVDSGDVRDDLYYRLNGLSVRLPALRERSDLAALVQRILQTEAPQGAPEVDAAVMDLFRRHRWPGNLRQLGNVLHTALLLAAGEPRLGRDHLPDDFLDELDAPASHAAGLPAFPATAPDAPSAPAPRTLHEAETALIQQALDAAGGNISVASKRLGISRNTIYRKLRWNKPADTRD